jgi:hypothetical protein
MRHRIGEGIWATQVYERETGVVSEIAVVEDETDRTIGR